MAVLERSELEASPLADLHAIADQLGLDGFRRLRKAELIDAILSNGEGAPASVDRADEDKQAAADRGRERPGRPRRRGGRSARSRRIADGEEDGEEPGEAGIEPAAQEARERGRDAAVEGVVEVLPNGSGFLRVSPPEPSDDDVYISAAQVRRCELVSGDRVSGPVRTARRSERFFFKQKAAYEM